MISTMANKDVNEMQHLARDTKYWKGLDVDIAEYVNIKSVQHTKPNKSLKQCYPEIFQKAPGRT